MHTPLLRRAKRHPDAIDRATPAVGTMAEVRAYMKERSHSELMLEMYSAIVRIGSNTAEGRVLRAAVTLLGERYKLADMNAPRYINGESTE